MSVETLTFGCRLNTVETEAMRALAALDGRRRIVVNTCAVTEEAGRQARKAIRRAARSDPGAEIVVTGCGAEVETEAYQAMPEVARLIGNGEKLSPPAWAGQGIGPGAVMEHRAAAPSAVLGMADHTRTFVPVQNGCDHRCTFCVIPFGGGHSRSVEPGAVVEQVARIVEAGGREVVLTGVDLTAYGRELPGEPVGLGGLVRRLLREVPGLSSGRAGTLADATALLGLVVRELGSRETIASTYGLREGLLHAGLDADTRAQDPLIVATREEGPAAWYSGPLCPSNQHGVYVREE